MCLLHDVGGAFTQQPEALGDRISQNAGDLIKRSINDIDPARLLDYHTHVAGIGKGTDAFVNPKMLAWRNPFHRLKFKVYPSAAAVTDVDNADAEIVERLVRLITNIDGHRKHRWLYNPLLFRLWDYKNLIGGANQSQILQHRIYILMLAALFIGFAHLCYPRKPVQTRSR